MCTSSQLLLGNYFRIYLVKNADRIRTNDNIVVQEYIDKVLIDACYVVLAMQLCLFKTVRSIVSIFSQCFLTVTNLT